MTTPPVVIRPSWRRAHQRMKAVALFAVPLVALIVWRSTIPTGGVAIDLEAGLGAVFAIVVTVSVLVMAMYVRNASLWSDGVHVGWTGWRGQKFEHDVSGVELSRVNTSSTGFRSELIMIAWPGEQRLFRVDVTLWEPDDIDRWVSAVGVQVAAAPAAVIDELDLPRAYERVVGKPRVGDNTFFALVGAGMVALVVVVLVLFYR